MGLTAVRSLENTHQLSIGKSDRVGFGSSVGKFAGKFKKTGALTLDFEEADFDFNIGEGLTALGGLSQSIESSLISSSDIAAFAKKLENFGVVDSADYEKEILGTKPDEDDIDPGGSAGARNVYKRIVDGHEPPPEFNRRPHDLKYAPDTEAGRANLIAFKNSLILSDPDRVGIELMNQKKTKDSDLSLRKASRAEENCDSSGGSSRPRDIVNSSSEYDPSSALEKSWKNTEQLEKLNSQFNELKSLNELVREYSNLRNNGAFERGNLDQLFMQHTIRLAAGHKSLKDLQSVKDLQRIVDSNENISLRSFREACDKGVLVTGFLRGGIGTEAVVVHESLPNDVKSLMDDYFAQNHKFGDLTESETISDRVFAKNSSIRDKFLALEKDVLAPLYKTVPAIKSLIESAQKIDYQVMDGIASNSSSQKQSALHINGFSPLYDSLHNEIKTHNTFFPREYQTIKDRKIISFDLRASTETSKIDLRRVQALSAFILEMLGSKVNKYEGDGALSILPNTQEAKERLKEVQKLISIFQSEYGMNIRLGIADANDFKVGTAKCPDGRYVFEGNSEIEACLKQCDSKVKLLNTVKYSADEKDALIAEFEHFFKTNVYNLFMTDQKRLDAVNTCVMVNAHDPADLESIHSDILNLLGKEKCELMNFGSFHVSNKLSKSPDQNALSKVSCVQSGQECFVANLVINEDYIELVRDFLKCDSRVKSSGVSDGSLVNGLIEVCGQLIPTFDGAFDSSKQVKAQNLNPDLIKSHQSLTQDAKDAIARKVQYERAANNVVSKSSFLSFPRNKVEANVSKKEEVSATVSS